MNTQNAGFQLDASASSKEHTEMFHKMILSQIQEDKVREYREAFNLYDKDHDGVISTHKLGVILRSLGHNPTELEIQEMIDEVDHDRTGSVEFEDFLEVVMSKDLDEEDHELALKEAFKMFDRDGNGYIDADELRLCMMNLGEKLTLDEVEEMIKEVDVDYDGRMNYEEFVKLMCTKYPLM
ncbi:calmodulin-beta-like isoform X1 [Mytilus californianus]|uniref:CALM n=1 Tax=Mytilus coruscus TaxID=42192 RepID=A0A6J8AAE4_MYTCO|nr:calmodulin-beta-like isoform X1 [Mytilus californianus]CAC5363516.1 CALM [Mytilus coruscus]